MGTVRTFVEWLGAFPERPELALRVVKEWQEERYVRRLVEYTSYGETLVPAFLLLPNEGGVGRRRGVVAIHQDGNRAHKRFGKSEVAGLLGDADQRYGVELAERGFVVLCPDRRGFEDRQGSKAEPEGLRGELFELTRAVDVLLSLPEVDGSVGVGAIGHSAGGWKATMLACAEPRVGACAVSCGTWLWRWGALPVDERPEGRIPKPFMPGLGSEIDQDDMMAGIAPRPYLQVRTDPWPRRFMDELFTKARGRYGELGMAERLEYVEEDTREHCFPIGMRERCYGWLERWLVPELA